MRHTINLALALFAISGFLMAYAWADNYTMLPIPPAPSQPQTEIVPVLTEPGHREAGVAALRRSGDGFHLHFRTHGLRPDSTYMLGAVVVNNPEACDDLPCSNDDLRNPETRSGVFWATGGISDARGVLDLKVFSRYTKPVGSHVQEQLSRLSADLTNRWRSAADTV